MTRGGMPWAYNRCRSLASELSTQFWGVFEVASTQTVEEKVLAESGTKSQNEEGRSREEGGLESGKRGVESGRKGGESREI